MYGASANHAEYVSCLPLFNPRDNNLLDVLFVCNSVFDVQRASEASFRRRPPLSSQPDRNLLACVYAGRYRNFAILIFNEYFYFTVSIFISRLSFYSYFTLLAIFDLLIQSIKIKIT